MARSEIISLFILSAIGVCLSSSNSSRSNEDEKKPHIVFILADDLGWNDISWNNPHALSPQLEKLAREGIILDQSYVQPICTPTRSALMTSRYPYALGRQHGVIRPKQPTGVSLKRQLLPEAMQAAGYSTHIVGKWHLGFCSWDYTPTSRGFDTFWGYYCGAEDYYHHTRAGVEEMCLPTAMDPNIASKMGYDFRNNTEVEYSVDGEYSTYSFTSYAVDLLESRNQEEPMFLYLPFQSVHGPLQVPKNYTDPFKHVEDSQRRTKLGMVLAMDEAVGRIVDALKRSGHYNDTIIIFSSDNGGPPSAAGNNWPLRGSKGTIWEGGTRVPAFVHSPLLSRKGVVSNELIHVTDWFPTIIALAGGAAPKDTHGYDQWDTISIGVPSRRVEMVYNIDTTLNMVAGVRLGDYKLLVGDPGDGHWTPPPEGFNVTEIEDDDESQQRHEDERRETETEAEDGEGAEGIPSDETFDDIQSIEEQRHATTNDRQKEKNFMERITNIGPFVVQANFDVLNDPEEEEEEEEEEDEEEEGNEESNGHSLTSYDCFDKNKPKDQWKVVDESVTLEDINFDFSKFKILKHYLNNNTDIRLFNLIDDPNERINIARDQAERVQIMMGIIQYHMKEYVQADLPKEDPAGEPKLWNNTWSPGWCDAKSFGD